MPGWTLLDGPVLPNQPKARLRRRSVAAGRLRCRRRSDHEGAAAASVSHKADDEAGDDRSAAARRPGGLSRLLAAGAVSMFAVRRQPDNARAR